jgi:hypothetical protein
MMKRQWLAGLVVLAGAAYLAGVLWKPPRQGPRIEVSPNIDLGQFVHGEERTVRVGFRNVGDAELTVDPTVLACACAKPKLDRESGYAPGETGWIELTLKPAASPGSTYRQQIQLDSNDRSAPRQYIVVSGKMQSALTLSPAQLFVAKVAVGEPWRRTIKIGPAGEVGIFQIIRLSCTLPGVELSDPLELAPDEKGNYEIEVRHPGARSLCADTGRIEILTNSPVAPRLIVPIELHVSSHVKIDPATVLFRADEPHEKTVRLTATSPFTLKGEPAEDVEFELAPVAEDRREWQVRLHPAAATWEKPQVGALPLTVEGDGMEHELTIGYVLLPSRRSE